MNRVSVAFRRVGFGFGEPRRGDVVPNPVGREISLSISRLTNLGYFFGGL